MPDQLYGIILPTPEEMRKASTKLETVPLSVEIIDEFSLPVKFKDTSEGKIIKKKRNEILERIRDIGDCHSSKDK